MPAVEQHDIKRQKRKRGQLASRIGIALLPDVSFTAVPQNPSLLINHGEQSEQTYPSQIPEVTSIIQEQDEDPGYSTIQELSRECGSSLGPAPAAPSTTILPAKSAEQEFGSEDRSYSSSAPPTPPQHLDLYAESKKKVDRTEPQSHYDSEQSTPLHSPENLYAKPHKKFHKKDVSTNTEPSENCNLREKTEQVSDSLKDNIYTSVSKQNAHQIDIIDKNEKEDAFESQVSQLETWKQMKLENKISGTPPKLTSSVHQYGSLISNSAVDRDGYTEYPKIRLEKNEALKEKVVSIQNCVHELNVELMQYQCSRHKSLDESNISLTWQDEIRLLWQRVREVVEENKELHRQKNSNQERSAGWIKECENKNTQISHMLEENTILREQNKQLKESLIQCEHASKREVESLAAEFASAQMEKVQITGELKRAQEKNSVLKHQCFQLSKEKENVVSHQKHLAFVQESHRLLEELKRKYREELDKSWDQINMFIILWYKCFSRVEPLELVHSLLKKSSQILGLLDKGLDLKNADERNCQLSSEVEELKRKIKLLQEEKVAFLETNQITVRKCEILTSLLQESYLQKSQIHEILDGLLQIAEHVTSERDVAIKKSHNEEGRHQHLLNNVLHHSLIIGRMQEHVKNYKLKAISDLKKAEARAQDKVSHWENQKQEYEMQLHSLRNTVVKKEDALISVQNEKRHLELDLETLWQVICEDFKITSEKIQLLTM